MVGGGLIEVRPTTNANSATRSPSIPSMKLVMLINDKRKNPATRRSRNVDPEPREIVSTGREKTQAKDAAV